MAYLDTIDSEGLRIILCLEFDPHAEPAQVAELKAARLDSPNTVHSIESTGDFDFMTEIAALLAHQLVAFVVGIFSDEPFRILNR